MNKQVTASIPKVVAAFLLVANANNAQGRQAFTTNGRKPGRASFGLAAPGDGWSNWRSSHASSVILPLSKLLMSVPPAEASSIVVRLKAVLAIQLQLPCSSTTQRLQIQKYSVVGVKPTTLLGRPRSVCQSFKSSQSTLRFVRYPRGVVDLRLGLGPPRLPAPWPLLISTVVPRLSSLRLLHLFSHLGKAYVHYLCPGAVFAAQQRISRVPIR